jgi:hypothetical protein
MIETLREFSSAGMQASFHYADDTGAEWSKGDECKQRALKLFDENPDLHPQMREAAASFLWSLSMERKLP